MQKYLRKVDLLKKAEKYGIDLTLLYKNFHRTPTERIENFLQWLEFSEMLKKVKQRKKEDVKY